MIGNVSPTTENDRFVQTITALESRVAELERVPQAGNRTGRRNLLDNGQHAVSQRYGTAATVNLPNSTAQTFVADRWGNVNNRSTGTIQSIYTTYPGYSIGLPAGRPQPAQILRMGVSVAGSALGANDYVLWRQGIEGVNLQHLDWATSRAKSLTLSFDCYSSAGGTFVYELYNSVNGRASSKAFTVAAGVTTTVVLTFPGDTGGTVFANTPAEALSAQCFIAAGTTFSSAGAYTTNDWNTPTGSRAYGVSTNFGTTAGHTFVITNAQLEVGTAATPFEVIRYSDVLRDCQRYLQRYGGVGSFDIMALGAAYATTTSYHAVHFKATMRAAPTLSAPGALTDYRLVDGVNAFTPTSIVAWSDSNRNVGGVIVSVTGPLTQFRPYYLESATTSGVFDWSAEI